MNTVFCPSDLTVVLSCQVSRLFGSKHTCKRAWKWNHNNNRRECPNNTLSPKVLLEPLITANKRTVTCLSAYLVRVLYMNTKPKFLKIMIENKKFSKSFTFVLQIINVALSQNRSTKLTFNILLSAFITWFLRPK